MFYIFPYTQNSEGAIALAEELEGKRILREGSSYKFKAGHTVINWGASDCPYPQALNPDVSPALNKVKFFERLKGTGLTPNFARTLADAKKLTYPIFCRTKIKGRDGAGIVIADNEQQLVNCDLYVEGIDKTSEYRLHVGRLPNGQVRTIGAQKKIKKAPTSEMTNIPADSRVWCGDTTSFVWKVGGQPAYIPPAVVVVVDEAFARFPELHFGAFDVVYDNSSGKAYVIEINSAPMATPETMKRYGSFFRDYADNANFIAPEPQSQPEPAPVPVASPVVAAPLTVETVLSDLNYEKLSLKTVIEGYIQSCQMPAQ